MRLWYVDGSTYSSITTMQFINVLLLLVAVLSRRSLFALSLSIDSRVVASVEPGYRENSAPRPRRISSHVSYARTLYTSDHTLPIDPRTYYQ
jgi:hypothetical protein